MRRSWLSSTLVGILWALGATTAKADLGPVLGQTHIFATDPASPSVNGYYTAFLVEIKSKNGQKPTYYPTILSFDGLQDLTGSIVPNFQIGTLTLVDSPIFFKSIVVPPQFGALTQSVEGQPGDLYDWSQQGDSRDVIVQFYNGNGAGGIFLDNAIVLHNCRPVKWGVHLKSTPSEFVSPNAAYSGWAQPSYPFYSAAPDPNPLATFFNYDAAANNEFMIQDHLDLVFSGMGVVQPPPPPRP